MNQETLQISDVIIEDRQRLDLGDIESMGSSIKENGTILPITLERRADGSLRLIDGMRRLSGCKLKGYTTLYHGSVCDPDKPGYVYSKELTPDRQQELELEADVRRKDRTWQEKCIATAKIHQLKMAKSAIEGRAWGQRETATVTGDSLGKVNYSIEIARKLLENRESNYWKCDSLQDAWRLRIREDEEQNLAELAKRSRLDTIPTHEIQALQVEASIVTTAQNNPDALADERERYYSNPLNPPDSFDTYWKERTERVSNTNNTVYLSNRLILGDSIAHMMANPGMYDHIITDIPYGIKMENLTQDGGGILDIDTTAEEHEVEYNLKLIMDFFPAAFNCTKDKAFVLTWCDQDLWGFMNDCAIKAGFKVQRWPFIWLKPNALNSCASYNVTKATEIVMFCRKPAATLVDPVPLNYGPVCTSAVEKKLTGHPFAKPFVYTELLANMVSISGQSILDPFAGGGSIILKLLTMKRQAFGVELNVAHYNALIENVKQHYLSLNPNFIFK